MNYKQKRFVSTITSHFEHTVISDILLLLTVLLSLLKNSIEIFLVDMNTVTNIVD